MSAPCIIYDEEDFQATKFSFKIIMKLKKEHLVTCITHAQCVGLRVYNYEV